MIDATQSMLFFMRWRRPRRLIEIGRIINEFNRGSNDRDQSGFGGRILRGALPDTKLGMLSEIGSKSVMGCLSRGIGSGMNSGLGIEGQLDMSKGFIGARQTTIRREIILTGTGVHSGSPVSIVLHPADADTGIRFLITKGDEIKADIAADVHAVSNVTLCTVLSDANGASVATVEHLLAALRGLCVDNVHIEIDSGEVPIMDGSSAAFVEAIDEVGIRELSRPRKYIKVLKPIRIDEGDCWGELAPHSGFHLDVEIDFDTPLIGRQRMAVEMSPGIFRSEISRARTFGFMRDVEQLWAAGLALGASLENSIALGDERIINPEGLRFKDEFVRHKTLDAVGDLALAGAPLLASFKSVRGGHRLNSLVVKALLADKEAWSVVHAPSTRDTIVHAESDLSFGVAAAANFAADRG